jgi:uncharacterized protein
MKLSKVAAAVAALLATDAKPTEAQIMAACIAADKKGKDEGGLGPVEIQNKAKDKKGSDEFPPKDKAEDGDDPEKTNDEFPEKAKDEKDDEDKAKDEEVDGMDDVQPAQKPDKARAGAEPAKDKKGMDAAGVAALIAANDAKHAAAREVESILGVVAYDSAAEYYKAALVKLGVDTDGVHASAFPSLLKVAKDRANAQAPTMASDAARVSSMATAIKGYDRLR